MEIGNIMEIDYKSVNINGHEYQAPTPVIKALQTLRDEVYQEKRDHEKTKEKLKENTDDFIRKNIKRIVYNLADGNPLPVRRTGISTTTPKNINYKETTCLAFDIYDFEVHGDKQVYAFSDEVYRRINQACNGLKNNGEKFR